MKTQISIGFPLNVFATIVKTAKYTKQTRAALLYSVFESPQFASLIEELKENLRKGETVAKAPNPSASTKTAQDAKEKKLSGLYGDLKHTSLFIPPALLEDLDNFLKTEKPRLPINQTASGGQKTRIVPRQRLFYELFSLPQFCAILEQFANAPIPSTPPAPTV